LPVESVPSWPYKGACVGIGAPTMLNQDQHIGGKAVHIRDCYVWAEIFYLDSPTDYRE